MIVLVTDNFCFEDWNTFRRQFFVKPPGRFTDNFLWSRLAYHRYFFNLVAFRGLGAYFLKLGDQPVLVLIKRFLSSLPGYGFLGYSGIVFGVGISFGYSFLVYWLRLGILWVLWGALVWFTVCGNVILMRFVDLVNFYQLSVSTFENNLLGATEIRTWDHWIANPKFYQLDY